MPLTWNGVAFHEQCPQSPTGLSINPAASNSLTMGGWFDWEDVITQAASKAYLGWCQVTNGYVPVDGNDDAIPGVAAAPEAVTYFNYTNPLAHPDWPNQMFLADSFDQVRGSVPNVPSITERGTASFDECLTHIHFRSPKNGYRVLPDYLVLDIVEGRLQGGRGRWAIPREYFCTRNMEIVEKTTSKAQTIPGNAGLKWRTLAPNGGPGVGNGSNSSATNFINLDQGEISIKWYPVPIDGYNESAAFDLIGKTNDAAFPPAQPLIAGLEPPRSFFTQRGGQKALATLVWGQPEKEIIRMGDCQWALSIQLRLRYFPHGANAFYWPNPVPGARGRIRIDPVNGPVQDPTLGGPGYYLMSRDDGTVLFPPGDYRLAFVPRGQTL